MAVSANKGHADRVLERRARTPGLCLAPYNAANPEGWWWPLIDGVPTRTARVADQAETDHLVLGTLDAQTPLSVRRPLTLGNPGNERPFGLYHFIHQDDPGVSVSWDVTVVYLRGYKVLDGLPKIAACTIHEDYVFVFTATDIYSVELGALLFDGASESIAANNALLTSQVSYADNDLDALEPGQNMGAYISPLGSRVVVLTTTKIRTMTAGNSGSVTLDTSDQPALPPLSNISQINFTDDFAITRVPSTGDPHSFRYTGGFVGGTTVDFSYAYQYGVTWSGETPQPITMTANRHFELAYDQEADGTVNWVDETEVSSLSGGCVCVTNYSESSTNVLTGLGSPITMYSKTSNHSRTYTQDAAMNWPGDIVLDQDIVVTETDTTTERRDMCRLPDGSVLVSHYYVGDNGAQNTSFSGQFIRTPVPADPDDHDTDDFVDHRRWFPAVINMAGYGVIEYPGAFTEDLSVALDGNEVLTAQTSGNRFLADLGGFFLSAAGMTIPHTHFLCNDVYGWNAPCQWTENFFDFGFLRTDNGPSNGNTTGGWGHGNISHGKIHGKIVLVLDSFDTLPDYIFITDYNEPYTLLDVPADARAAMVGVI